MSEYQTPKDRAYVDGLVKTVFIAAALRAGGAAGNGLLAMRLFEEACTENT